MTIDHIQKIKAYNFIKFIAYCRKLEYEIIEF